MDRKQLYFGFDGRIDRVELWLGLIVLLLAFFILNTTMLLALSTLGRYAGIADETIGREAYLLMILIWLAALYPFSALLAKRLADRGRPRWLAGVFAAPSAVWYFGLLTTALDVRVPATPLWWHLVSVAILLWLVVDLGILRGRSGGPGLSEPRRAPG